jgi:hypothetical protein
VPKAGGIGFACVYSAIIFSEKLSRKKEEGKKLLHLDPSGEIILTKERKVKHSTNESFWY